MGRVRRGDIVLFNEGLSKGYVPAIVETVFPIMEGEDKKQPDIALVVFIVGYHAGSYTRTRVAYGKKENLWIFREDEPGYKAPNLAVPKVLEDDSIDLEELADQLADYKAEMSEKIRELHRNIDSLIAKSNIGPAEEPHVMNEGGNTVTDGGELISPSDEPEPTPKKKAKAS